MGLFSTIVGLILAKEVCYNSDNIGCFDNSKPFDNALHKVPDSPSTIGVEFLLYTRSNPTTPQTITASSTSIKNSYFDGKENTKFIIHGFSTTTSYAWIKDMTAAILKKENANVIVVGWDDGSNDVTYSQAAANTRVVGAMMAELMKALQSNAQASYASMHLIGHSLGAHIAGYAGEIISGIGRITGLDPAGPYFRDEDILVRLDPNDATFVDVIHTDGEPLSDLGFGLEKAIGDVDFYPNGGTDQPGCDISLTKSFLDFITGKFDGSDHIFDIQFSWIRYRCTTASEYCPLDHSTSEALTDDIACSHLRSFYLFTESINSACQFQAYPCSSYSDYKAGKCSSCGTGCAAMGYTTDTSKSGTFYLTTASSSPYCQG